MSKTIIISHSHPLLKYGGGEVAAYRQYQHMRNVGEDAIFVGATIGWAEANALLGPDQKYLDMGGGDFLVRTFGMDNFHMEQASPEFEDWLVDFLKSLDGDVYHFHHFWNIGTSTIKRLRDELPNRKFILTVHELTAICANHGQMVKAGSGQLCSKSDPLVCSACLQDRAPIEFKLRRRRLLGLFGCFDVIISPSHFLSARLVDWGINSSRIHVLENGLPSAEKRSTLCSDDAKRLSHRFAFFGQATPTKGLGVLVQAAQIAEDTLGCTLDIEVFGSTKSDFEELYPDEDIPRGIRFRGRYRPEEAVSLMRKFGWLVMPSTWWENSPVIIQEAMAAGTPMVVSNIGGMLEKTEGWGIPFQVGNPFDLASTLVQLNGNASALAEAVEAMPQPFSTEQFFKEWKELL